MPSVTPDNTNARPLLRQLLLVLLPAFLLLAAALLLLTYRSTSTMVDDSIRHQLEEANDRLQILLDSYLSGLDGLLSASAEQSELAQTLSTGNRNAAEDQLQNMLEHRHGEHLDLLMLSRQEKLWVNLNSPLYAMEHRQQQLIAAPPLYHQWTSIELDAPFTRQTALVQRYPVIAPDSGQVTGSLFGGVVLNDNLSLLRQLARGAENFRVQLILHGKPVGPAYLNNNDIAPGVFTQVLASQQPYGQIQGHYFSLQPLRINDEPSELQLLLLTDNTIAQQLQQNYGYHTLLALMLVLLAALLLSLYTLRLISVPLASLTRFAERVSQGKKAAFQPDRIQEFNFLGSSLESMVTILQQNELRLAHLFDAANSATIIVDNDDRIQALNQMATALFERGHGELVGTPLTRYFSPEQLAPLQQAIDKARKGHRVDDVEARLGPLPRQARCQLWTLAPVFTNQVVTAVQLQGQDISRLKQAEESLQLNRLVLANMLEAVMIFDRHQRLVYANPAYTRLTGFMLDNMVGQPPDGALPLQADDQSPWQAVDTHGHWQGELRCRTSDSATLPLWLSIRTLANERGETSHYVAVFSNIPGLRNTTSQDH
ncbi:LuxQ periplasmic sensor domain-containing protein [Oceanimonas sp. CHS3-5]|uniref:LuxQ periplasmic sensor domain-containing protein n=1 Tax=Oceanimonas sp. CHS3-5 TaxID=3068186 RepID=UPI00273F87B6|nr:LuxQ periplasmic sensor domain-containing protein [Oceanimonas sp. CHS3-5]MDP5293469.1 LuxQ periplasmic sensor domain-containing protein [Oceanimonas sp. CHS3-5]